MSKPNSAAKTNATNGAQPRKPSPPRRPEKAEADLLFADDASTAMKMTDSEGASLARKQRRDPKTASRRQRPPSDGSTRPRRPNPKASGSKRGPRPPRPANAPSKRSRPTTGRVSNRRPPSGRIPPKPNAQAPVAPKPGSSRPKRPMRSGPPSQPTTTPSPPSKANVRPRGKAILVRRGEYFDGPEEEEELAPLEGVSLPRSLIEEEEEKDFRKRFNRSAEDEVVDIYSADRHAAVTVKDSQLEDDTPRQVGSFGFLVVLSIILMFAASGAGVFIFRKQLREPLMRFGIEIPK